VCCEKYVANAILNQVKTANTTLIVIAIGNNYVVKLINLKSRVGKNHD